MVVFYPLLETGSLMLASLASGYNSFFLIPLVPIMLELSCELAFPVGEGTAVGLLFATGNLFGFVLGLLMSLIVEGESKAQTAGGLAFCFGVFVIGIILAYFMKERLNRKNFERDSDKRRSELSQREGSQLESASNT
jgi:MFS transporter, FLVCR family, feline leukemia virus subgroup C receptor-related protein